LSAYTIDTRRIAERVAVVNTRHSLFGKLGCRLATSRTIELSEIGGHPDHESVQSLIPDWRIVYRFRDDFRFTDIHHQPILIDVISQLTGSALASTILQCRPAPVPSVKN